MERPACSLPNPPEAASSKCLAHKLAVLCVGPLCCLRAEVVVVDQFGCLSVTRCLATSWGGREDGCWFSSGVHQPILNARIRLQKCVFILSSDGRESSVSLLLLFLFLSCSLSALVLNPSSSCVPSELMVLICCKLAVAARHPQPASPVRANNLLALASCKPGSLLKSMRALCLLPYSQLSLPSHPQN